MATAADKKRWDELHAALVKAQAAYDAFDRALWAKYRGADGRYDRNWLPKGKRDKIERLDDAKDKIGDKIIDLIVRVSPRGERWLSGAPSHWLRNELTWEDVIRPASEELSVVVPGSWGYADGTMREAPAEHDYGPDAGRRAHAKKVLSYLEDMLGGEGWDDPRLLAITADWVDLSVTPDLDAENLVNNDSFDPRDLLAHNVELKENRIMASRRKKASKGKGGRSGGANPRNSREISEQQHDEAMRVLRAEYFTAVRGIVEELQQAIKDGEITDRDGLEERLHQDIDSSYWVIYTHANFQVLMCSDHHDAYSEEYGQPAVEGNDINWAALAFAAMQRDVQDLMSAEGVEIPEGYLEEAPRGARESSLRGTPRSALQRGR